MFALLATLLHVVLAPPDEAAPERVEVAAVDSPAGESGSGSIEFEPPSADEAESESEPPTEVIEPEQPRSREFVEISRTGPEPEPPKSWQAEIFVDLYYAFNNNSPDNHIMRGFVPAPRSGEIVPGVVGGFIRHTATDEEPWWIELGFHAGPNVDSLVEHEPIAGGDQGRFAGIEVFKHIALANAGFRIKKTKTSIGAGVLESPFGLSSFWSFRNSTYTPMWQNTIVPYYFAGARISQQVPGGLTISAWVVNGAQTYSDLYKVPSGVLSLSWSPAPRKGMKGLTVNSHVLFGPERESTKPADWYVLWDSTIWWSFDDHFSMGAAWDYAVERPGRSPAEKNVYTGGGILARGCVLERKIARLDLTLRPDVLWDRDGYYYGVPQWIIASTVGADLALWERLNFRVTYRYDYSTNPVGFFYRGPATSDDSPGLARSQHTLYFALVGIWDFWFGRHTK